MNRRDTLKNLGFGVASLAAASVPSGAAAAPGVPCVKISQRFTYPGVEGKLLVNKPRAYEVMDALHIDGLIAATPINVHYLSNTISTLTKMHAEQPAFATFPRKPSETAFFITSTGNGMTSANGEREVPEIMPFSYPQTAFTSFAHDAVARPSYEPPAMSGKFAVEAGAHFTKREQGWLAAQDKYNANVAPSSLWALVRALRASGLVRGTVAVDDMGIVPALQAMGLTDVKFIPGNNVFKRIRMIKSAPELALMRVAQANNAAAAMAAAHALQVGMTYAEFERRYQAECAARGSAAGFILLGFTQALLPDDEIVAGKSYMLDAFSEFQGYFGDFARTVVVGEPRKEVVRRFKAQQIGRAEGFEKIRPGVPFSVVQDAARVAMVKAGMPESACRAITLHSVGLQHIDHPSLMELPFDLATDMVLQEGMTITLDLPYLELGWGAGHNEDMLLVTQNGYEVLNDASEPLVIV